MDKRHCWRTIVAAVLTAAGIITILCINQLSAAERVTNIIYASCGDIIPRVETSLESSRRDE